MVKKKLSKKEKAKLEAEQAETLRIEMERERQKKLEEDRERKMRERRDARKKQEQEAVENKLRRVQLRNSSHIAKRNRKLIKRVLKDNKLDEEWKNYMRCNGLPNACDPSDLRKYLHMWNDERRKANEKEINWMLKSNEQSFLTQDQSVQDLSRENMKKIQTDIGGKYAKRASEVLGILDEIDTVILDRFSLSPSRLDDLLDLKSEIRAVLSSYINEFTFKILSNIERNMSLSGLTQARYKFESPVFVNELYALRDIPLPQPTNPKEKMKEEKTNVELDCLKMSLVLPSSIKLSNAAIRGMWLNFDHMSDYCFSIIPTYEDGERKKLTLRQTTKREWKKRKELLQKALVQIFNEKPDDSEEQNKPRVIDVDRMYTEYEDGLNAIEREKIGPQSLGLDEFEVNLRSHRITGGIFQIEYFEQPLQDVKSDEGALLRSLIHPVELKKKPFHYFYKPPPPVKPGQKRMPEEVEAEIKFMEENMERMVLVNIDLPDTVAWLEPPIICRFESQEEYEEVKALELELKKKIKKDDEDLDDMEAEEVEVKSFQEVHKKQNEVLKKQTRLQQTKIIEDFNLLKIPKNVNLKPLFEEFIIPMIPDGYEIKFHQSKKQLFDEGGRKCFIENKIHSVTDVVFQTEQPKIFHPKFRTKKILKILKNGVEKKRKFSNDDVDDDDDDEGDEHDESVYTTTSGVDSTTTSANHRKKFVKESVYMLSKFMRDLEDLIDAEMPSFEKKISEISANLSKTNETDGKDKLTERKDSSISITKANSKSIIEVSTEDSDADSDTDNEEIEEENAHREMIDKIFKEANLKRCYGRWSTRDIHESKFNEDKLTIQFRTGRLGYFAFATNRFSNLPYQSWEFKPDFKNPGATFTLTAAQLVMEVQVTTEGITLNSLQGGNCPASISNVIGSTMKLDELIKLMRNCACDVFPDDDSFCYSESSCEKNYVLEMNIYNSMSNFVLSHNFAWSRWNFAAGSRTCVFLMRELQEMRKLPNQSTIHVTPFKACFIDCTEVSPVYCSTVLPGDYYADLYQLGIAKMQPASRTRMDEMNPMLRQNVFELLKSIRPLSFC